MVRAAAIAALLLAGCSESPYPNLHEKNVAVHTVASGGRVRLEVHSLDERCAATYEGFIALDRPLVEVGLPVGKPSLLVFEFHTAGVQSSDGPTKKEVHLLPRAGNRYEARVAYKEAIYDIELREKDPRAGTDREIDTNRRC